MGNTSKAELVKLSQKIYQEWYPMTVLVQSCDNQFEGELNLETRELDIPVYHDLSIHLTTIKERELKPAGIEFIKASTKRVSIDRGRYSHYGVSEISKLVENLSAEESAVRQKLVNRWAVEAEKELATWVAQLPAPHLIDLKSASLIPAVTGSTPNAAGQINKHSVIRALDILKAKVIDNDMMSEEFTLFASEHFETVLRDANLVFDAIPSAQGAFATGEVGRVNGVNVRKIQVRDLTERNDATKLVEAEWAIWKTRDGIQYVVPYKNTLSYEILPDQILMGGTGYQIVEYYDFFNLYPSRLYKVQISYDGSTSAPSL
jgi:hypothetical protein